MALLPSKFRTREIRASRRFFSLLTRLLLLHLRATRAPSTLRRRNLWTEVSLWKHIKCFPSTPRRRHLKTRQHCRWFWICVWGKSSQGNHDAIAFEKLRFQNVLCLHWGAKPVFSNSFSLTSVFEKLRFHDGLVWTVGLTVEIKLRFQNSPVKFGQSLKTYPLGATTVCPKD